MKILRVKLTNLNSLRGPIELDFQKPPLAGAGLFAITGPTGAGKSTLLDAITLALYGKAARYGSTPSPADMMSRHSGACQAEVEFQVRSGTYRAEWQLRRARGKADGNIQAPKRFVYDSAGTVLSQNVHQTEELIERLIGLDYPRFVRSVLLAQGEFAQFLKARPDERAELLESLTGTSIYSALGTLAHSETARRETALHLMEAAIGNIQLLSDEERAKLQGEIPAAEAQFNLAKHELAEANALLNKAGTLATALSQEESALKSQETLAADKDAAAMDLQLLARHRHTIPFQADLARLDAADKTAKSATALFQTATLDHSRVLIKAAACLRGLRKLLAHEIEAATSEISNWAAKGKAALGRKQEANKWLKEHKCDKALPDKLPELVANLADLKASRRDLDREWKKLLALAIKLDKTEAEALTPGADSVTCIQARTTVSRLAAAAGKQLSAAKSAEKVAIKQLARRQADLEKARLTADFEAHRASLKSGEPCPLCGSTKHPFAESSAPSFPFEDLNRQVEAAELERRQTEKQIRDLEHLSGEIKEVGREWPGVIARHTRLVARLEKGLGTFALAFPIRGQEDLLRGTIQKRASDYRSRASEEEKAEHDHALAQAERSRGQSALDGLLTKQAALSRESLRDLPMQQEAQAATETLLRWRTVDEAESAWSTSKTDLTSKRATLYNRQTDNKQWQIDLSNLLSAVSAKLPGSAFATIDDLKSARLDPERASKIENLEISLGTRAATVNAELRAARESIKKWRAEKAPEGEAVAALRSRQANVQLRHDQLIADLTTAKNRLAQDDANRATIVAKQREFETARQQLLVWQRLRGLIGSCDGRLFRRYAQALSLDVLVTYANRHLVRLSDRYRLCRRQDQELDLQIEDLHQAGTVRPMASLSGGESFLASLALALGLSDIAGRSVRIESLFIDEGFGSLDSDTLDTAISALETLRQDSKTIGVISHVDLLKERIATQIIVEKQAGGTSRVRLS